MKQKGQNLGLLLLQGLDCLTLPSLHLFILCNELVMLSFSSFPYIVFFLQVFWYKFGTLLKFFSDKTNKNQPLLSYTFYYVFVTSVILSCTSRFFFSPNLSIAFFSFFELSSFRFRYRLCFLSICFWSTFTCFKSLCNVFKKSLIFREIFTPYTGTFDF